MNATTRVKELLAGNQKGLAVAEIAEAVGCAVATAKHAVDRLKKLGCVDSLRVGMNNSVYLDAQFAPARFNELMQERLDKRRRRDRCYYYGTAHSEALRKARNERKKALRAIKKADKAAGVASAKIAAQPVSHDDFIDPPIVKRLIPAGEWSFDHPTLGPSSVWALAA